MRDNAFVLPVANHAVGLATAGLAVCKQAAVVAGPCVVKDLLAESLVDELLIGIGAVVSIGDGEAFVCLEAIMAPEAVVEGEGTVLAT